MSIRLQLLVAAAFVGTVGLVLAAAAWELFRVLLERSKRAAPSRSRFRPWYRRAVLSLGAAGILCMVWGRFVEPFWPEVTRVRIESAKLRPGARPLRIVHVSDLHCDPKPRLEGRLPALVAAERPDLVVFTGDAINDPAGLPHFRGAMAELARVAPVFGVKGNWDAWYWPRLDRFAGTGVRELDGASVRLEIGGSAVRVAGMGFGNEGALDDALAGAVPSELLLFLYHSPDLAYELADRGVDLAVAGHTHGGQVALPFYGALVTLSKFGKRFESGLREVGAMKLHVNRGLGMEGGAAPRVRFCCRPEITVLEIVPR